MFKKVLVSDDLGSINQGVLTVLDTLGVKDIKQVQYCDDAYLQIKSADLKQQPFDLFITDLSFKTDYRTQKYPSGEAIIKQLKQEYPNLKTIVYSVEDRLQKVRTLVNTHSVNAYVCKGRRGLIELAAALNSVFNNELFLSPQVEQALSPKNNLEIDDYDLELLKQLSFGYSKEQISELFRAHQITPSSLSSVEKRQNKLFIQFKANNATHLVSIVKDLGLI